jgi:hypothetical protein
MSGVIKFIVDYEVEGEPVVYKVDEEAIKLKRNKDGVFGWDMNFNMHVATEEEIEEYENKADRS